MQVYAYKAVTGEGQMVASEVASDSAQAAREQVARTGLTLVELKRRRGSVRGRGQGESAEVVIEFTRHMHGLLTAGVPLIEVLEDLEQQAEKRSWRMRLQSIRQRVESGSTISEALAAQRGVFSQIYVNLVQAGEESGQLAEVFGRLTGYLEWRRAVSQQVRQALSYPILVFSAMGLLVGLLTFFVFPRLSEVFTALDVTLPLPTRILLAVGHFGARYWPFLVGLVPVGVLFATHLRHLPAVRDAIDRALLRLPVIGRVVHLVTYARFASSLATLLSSGVQLDRGLELAQFAVGNRVVSGAIGRVRDRVQGGETLADALVSTGGFPPLLVRMVRVGETSGDLVGMLQNTNDYFEREVPRVIRKALSAVGPIMVVTLGLMVVWVALAVFMPLMQIGEAVK
ncbi:MAG: hypothetical protein GF330_00675 [Candidatus Eisenbacteria bacterium]|nr:hypothetical protein [Candidatus Eisenbacteria bacterium]